LKGTRGDDGGGDGHGDRGATGGESPETAGTPEKEPISGAGKGKGVEKENQDVTDVTGSNNGQGQNKNRPTALVKTEVAPADWFNDCTEGRYRKACVKTLYLD